MCLKITRVGQNSQAAFATASLRVFLSVLCLKMAWTGRTVQARFPLNGEATELFQTLNEYIQ